MMKEEWEDLVGKKLSNIDDTKESVTFTFEDGAVAKFEVEADCCSSTWIEHFDAPSDAIGSVFRGVQENEVRQFWDGGSEDVGDYIQVYETVFLTDHGRVTCEYRNSSNGYYGGNLRRTEAT